MHNFNESYPFILVHSYIVITYLHTAAEVDWSLAQRSHQENSQILNL